MLQDKSFLIFISSYVQRDIHQVLCTEIESVIDMCSVIEANGGNLFYRSRLAGAWRLSTLWPVVVWRGNANYSIP